MFSPTFAIAIPCSGRYVPPEWAVALANLQFPTNTSSCHLMLKGMKRDLARSELVRQAIARGCRYVFFLDDDTMPPSNAIRLLYTVLENADDDVIACGGIYASKGSYPTEPLVYIKENGGPFWKWKVGQVFQCQSIGTGCLMMKTEAFAKIPEPWFRDINGVEEVGDDPSIVIQEGTAGFSMTDDVYFCFPPGVRVYGDQHKIEDYKKGDSVITQEGIRRRVSDTNVRKYKGDLLRITPKYGAGFQVTPRHEVLVERDGKRQFRMAEEILPGDYLVVPIPTPPREARVRKLPVWPFIRSRHVEFNSKKCFRYTKSHSLETWFPLQVDITQEFALLAGYWVSEGSVDEIGVHFTFHINEVEFANDVVRLIKLCFDLKASITENISASTRKVTCCSIAFADFLRGTFGAVSSTHTVPEDLLMGSPKCVKAFLKGFWRGDGYKRDGRFGMGTTSERLAHDLRMMLIREKIYPALGFYDKENPNHKGVYVVSIPSEFSEEWLAILGEGNRLIRKKWKCKQSAINRHLNTEKGDYFTVKISSVEREYYEGDVYNLQIHPSDPTYNVNGFTVHNCNKVEQAGLKILAHGGVLPVHWDQQGNPFTLPRDSYPMIGAGEQWYSSFGVLDANLIGNGKESVQISGQELPDGFLSRNEALLLHDLAKDKRVLEMGAFKGRSTVAMALSAKSVTSVDWHNGDAHVDKVQHGHSTLEEYRRNIAPYPNVTPVIGRFEDELPKLSGQTFDVVFVDGSHDKDSVIRDMQSALSFNPSVVAVHDWGYFEVTEGVQALGLTPARIVDTLAVFEFTCPSTSP